MNNLFLENKRYFYLFLALFFIALIAFYFLFSRPQYQERDDKKVRLAQIEEEINLLRAESESASGPSEDDLNNLKLLEKVPNSYEIEQFLLTLNEIELVSDSRFTGLELAYDGNLPEVPEEDLPEENEAGETEETEEVEEETEDQDTETDSADQPSEEEDSKVPFTFEDKPENMHVLTAHVTIASPNYKAFQKFLKEVELQERIMFVNTMTFTKPAEQELVLEELSNETIEFTADITTFFYSEE